MIKPEHAEPRRDGATMRVQWKIQILAGGPEWLPAEIVVLRNGPGDRLAGQLTALRPASRAHVTWRTQAATSQADTCAHPTWRSGSTEHVLNRLLDRI
jgi:hypothetical protein